MFRALALLLSEPRGFCLRADRILFSFAEAVIKINSMCNAIDCSSSKGVEHGVLRKHRGFLWRSASVAGAWTSGTRRVSSTETVPTNPLRVFALRRRISLSARRLMGCLTAVRILTVDGCDVQATTLGMAVSMAKRRGSSGCASSATRRTACVAAIEVCGISRKSWEMDVETDVEMGLAEDEGEEEEDNAFSSNGKVVDVKMSVRGETVRQEVQGKRCKSTCAKVHVGSMAMRIPTWTAKTGRIVLQTRKVKCWPKQVQVVAVDESVGSTPDVIPRLTQGLDDLLVCVKVI